MGKEISKSEGYVASGLPVKYGGEYGPVIDLGLAANPSGAAFEASQIAEMTSTVQITEYDENVHHKDVKDLLIQGIGLQGIENESVLFHPNGSYGAGDEVVRALSNYFLQRDHKMTLYVPTYSFPNVAQYTTRHGANYEPVPSEKSLFQSHSLSTILEMKKDQLKNNVVYVDYPNNPSGIAQPELLRKVVDHVSRNGGIPFVDLAFGEVLGREFREAIQYTVDRGGVCVGSLTKTQGLAALRAGYVIMNPDLAQKLYSKGEKLVFGLPAHVKNSYLLLFTKDNGMGTLAERQALKASNYNTLTNSVFYKGLEDLGMEIAPTVYETPIQILFNSKGDDLFIRFACAGIKTESLSEYADTLGRRKKDGYENSGIRVLTPRVGMVEQTLERIKIAMKLSDSDIESKKK